MDSSINKKVLVIDDDTAIVESVQMLLEMEGYDVVTMTEVNRISEIAQHSFDLILLDIWMSGQDGREISRLLKRQKKTKNVPIVMVSASKDIEKSTTEADADDFLTKPFDTEDLLSKVRKYTSN